MYEVTLKAVGAGTAQSQSTRLLIKRSRVRVPAGRVGKFSSPGSPFCADSSLISVSSKFILKHHVQ